MKVAALTECGFTYEDLQEQTVTADPIITGFMNPFSLGSAEFGSKLIRINMPTKQPKPGDFGVLVYCAHCRAGFLMQTTEVK